MSGEQLRLDFAELEPTRRDPYTCAHVVRTLASPPRVLCSLRGEVWTNCQQVRRCVYEPIDNSPAEKARRVKELGVIK